MTDAPRPPFRIDSAWREARALVAERRGRLAAGFALMLVSRGATVVLPATSKYLIDDVIGKGRHELLPVLAVAVIAAGLVQAAAGFAVAQLLGVAAHHAITDTRRRVQQHLLRLPTSYFDATKSGVLVSRVMHDPEGIRNVVGTGIVQLSGSIITATVALVVLLYLNLSLTLITLGAIALFGAFIARSFLRARPLYRERSKINAEISGRLAEMFGGIRVVKAYTAEKREDLVFAKGVHRNLRNVAKTITTVSGATAVAALMAAAVGVTIMVVGGRAILAGSMTIGELVMYIFFTGLLVSPMGTIAAIAPQLSEAFAGLDRVREVLAEESESADERAKAPVERIEGTIAFEDVSFEYKPGVPVLHDISFVAPHGTTTALVGPSGSGKSTLASLVLAFMRPTTGRVLLDGRDLSTLRLGEYRAHTGVVLQDNFLFDGTVTENLLYGNPGATREEMLEAARIAYVDEFVAPLELQYETIIGERGIKLSGGQRQRIAIARAILAKPSILVLDEATSSLDSESEAKIQEALRTLRGGRTTFVIAHRLSTIRSADQILVLERGRIVERGTHAELLAKNGRYRQLHDQQYRFERDLFVNPGEDFLPT